jgi:hypothetical protein
MIPLRSKNAAHTKQLRDRNVALDLPLKNTERPLFTPLPLPLPVFHFHCEDFAF